MALFHASPVANPFHAAQSSSPYPNSSRRPWRSTLGSRGDGSLFLLRLPSFRRQAVPGGRRLRISSRLGRLPRRRNALREKLLARPDQVRQVVEVTGPQLPPENAQSGSNLRSKMEPFESGISGGDGSSVHGGTPSTLDQDVEKGVQAEDSLGRGELEVGGKSDLLSKLENWGEQYKKDEEFWGIGSVPVFTIYKDSEGNVTRVSLNEDEIVRRTRIGMLSLRAKDFEDESMDESTKISRAKLIAKGIESGEYKLPKNSTIAKIVVEGSKSSFSIDRFRSLNCGGRTLFKVSPQAVFGVSFGWLVFWSVKKLLFTNDKTELTREEKEMLRRKLKSRKERGAIEKGSVEILKNGAELPVRSVQRPLLDKNELMKNIKAKASTEGSMISNLGSHFDVNNGKFKDQVMEIREMVKQVHELEREDQKRGNKSESYEGSLPTAKDNLPAMKSNANLETHSIVNGSDHSSISDDSVLAAGMEIVNSAGVMEGITVGSPSVVDRGESGETIFIDKFNKSDTTDSSVVGKLGCVNGVPIEVSAEPANPEDSSMDLNMGVLKNEKVEHELNKGKAIDSSISQDREGIQFNLTFSDNSSSIGKNSVQKKPKLILSVKEAREYLSRRCKSSTDKLSSNPETQDNCQPISSLASGSPSSMNERMEVVKLPDSDITEGAKDNNFPHESCSHKVLDHLPQAIDQKNNNESSFTAAATGLSSVDAETGETGYQNGKSSDHVEDKIIQVEAVTSVKTNKKEEVAAFEGTDGDGNLYKPVSSVLTDEGHGCQQSQVKSPGGCNDANNITITELNHKSSCTATEKNKSELTPVPTSMVRSSADTEMKEVNSDASSKSLRKADKRVDLRPSTMYDEAAVQGDTLETKHDIDNLSGPCAELSLESNDDNCHNQVKQAQDEKSWVERNFQQFDPIIKKIGVCFNENYMMAREKVHEQKMLGAEIGGMALEDEELEWMNDDSLREIVLKVRDNELAGREPFHLMDDDEQCAFFKGLERKTEKESKKLSALHEFIHSKIENIDYGMDSISLDDPLTKIMPRWKGPPINEDPKFLNNFARSQQVIFEGKMDAATEDTENSLWKSDQASYSDGLSPSSPTHNLRKLSGNAASVNPKTVIECSDGSSRAGKKFGREHWEHTKKWSREFLGLYNAEEDPEIKSIMRDMGKDLDKWITDKEIQDVADLMTRIPKRKQKYIEKKMDKLKREIEMFGHQAVVSKYREYSEEKEEDYLWWLDLRFILCIELYRTEDNVPKVGFYSLEMAEDLELNPKQYHVIAFEDPRDSKNFCYIIQAHMDILGNGSAFVVARPPKDAFREAKADGFNVTVIRKGELKLNIDQTLEEVEEEIIEIGSKMYHDKIMRERSVDMGALTEGVFRADKPAKRKSKRVPKTHLLNSTSIEK